MSYLLIRNKGVADFHLFTLLGASTARGDDNKIGQFGSGAKHSALTLLRMGVSPIVKLGLDELTYFTKEIEIGGVKKQRLWIDYKGQQEAQSVVTDFGSMDWDDPHMALREYISNAIDSGNDYSVQIVNEVKAVEGETRIFVPVNGAIMEYYHNLSRYFLHFVDMQGCTHFPNLSGEKCRVYRKGVYVGTMNQESTFHYNLPNIMVDESRNLKIHEAKMAIMKFIIQSMPVRDVVKVILGHEKSFECNNIFYDGSFGRNADLMKVWPMEMVIGNGQATRHLENFAYNMGKVIHHTAPDAYTYWKNYVPSLDTITSTVVNGVVVRALDGNVAENYNTVISYLRKEKLLEIAPRAMTFGGSTAKMFVRGSVLYLNENCDCYTIIEGLGELTGTDFTRASWTRLFNERALYVQPG